MDLCVCAVLPAAGCGLRLGSPTPKQFIRVRGQPIILHTVRDMSRIPWVRQVIVPAPTCHVDVMRRLCDVIPNVIVVPGAGTRHRSIQNGLNAVQHECDVLVIHDGVRPLVDEQLLWQIVIQANKHGAAGVTRPIQSTVVTADVNGFLQESLDTTDMCYSESPQAFRIHELRAAYIQCSNADLDHGTDCLDIVHRYTAVTVKLLEGPASTWKVTHRKDLASLECTLKDKELHRVCLVDFTNTDIEKYIRKHLVTPQIQVDDLMTSDSQILIVYCDPEPSTLSGAHTDATHWSMVSMVICVMSARGMSRAAAINTLLTRVRAMQSTSRLTHGIVVDEQRRQKSIQLLQHLILERNSLYSGQVLVAD